MGKSTHAHKSSKDGENKYNGFGQRKGIPKPATNRYEKESAKAEKERQAVLENTARVKSTKVHVKLDSMTVSRFISMEGSTMFRMRLVCSLLSGKAIQINNIRSQDAHPGLRDYEVSFLRLLDRISSGTKVKISPTGTSVKFTPGVLLGGSDIDHACPHSRCVGYFLEPLIALGPFCKATLSITLSDCVTNLDTDISADVVRAVTLPLLRHFGMGSVDMAGFRSAAPELKILKRGAPPMGGGTVILTCPVVKQLNAATLVDPGRVKKVRGLAYTTRCSAAIGQRMANTARKLFHTFIPDVYIYTDHFKGKNAGVSPGYAVGLAAETTTGCILSSQRTAMTASVIAAMSSESSGGVENSDTAPKRTLAGSVAQKEAIALTDNSLLVPEDVGRVCAKSLIEEISEGGCVDSAHQPLVLLLMALGPENVSKVRVGKLTPHAVATLRLIREFWKLQFKIVPDQETKTVVLSCLGVGLTNISRRTL